MSYNNEYEEYDYLYETNKATRRQHQKSNKWKYKTVSSDTKKPAAKIFIVNGSPADMKAREQAKLVKRAREHKGTIELKHHLYDPYILEQRENQQIETETDPDYGPLGINRQKLHFERFKERLTYYGDKDTTYYYRWGPIVSDHYYSTHSPSLIKGTWRKVRPTECDPVKLMNPNTMRRKRAFWELDEIDLTEPPYKIALLKEPVK